jgi:DNA repair exonuclease SbcCD ATPase subunit
LNDRLAKLNQQLIERDTEIRETSAALSNLNQDPIVMSLKRDLEGYAYVKGLLDKRPDACTIDDCPFIVNALEGQKQKAEKEKLLAQEQSRVQEQGEKLHLEREEAIAGKQQIEIAIGEDMDERTRLEKEDSEAVAQIDNQIQAKERLVNNHRQLIEKAQAEMAQYREELKQIPPKIQALEELAGKASDIAEAERNLRDINQAIHLENEAYSETSASLNEKWQNLSLKLNQIDTEISQMKDSAVSRPLIEKELADTENLLTSLDGARQQYRDRITTLKHVIQTCRDNIGKLQKDADRIEELKEREQFIRQEINRWTYARAAVSKSGLQAMEISAAAPLLTSLANDLLHEAFGGEFFVDLITQDPETGAEILDVMVTRGDGESYPLAAYSGGESVWLLQAFKAAQILVNAEKSGIQFLTAFADEETGQLDTEKAERFIKMYRALMNQGGFTKLVFISHIQECQAMADHVLEFEEGGIRAA